MMSTEIATLPAVEGFGVSAGQLIGRLEQVADEIRESTDSRFVADHQQRAQQAAKLLRALNETKDALVACIRFEMVCLRRLGQLGAGRFVEPRELQNIALALAKTPQFEFDEILAMVDHRSTSVIGVSRAFKRMHNDIVDQRWAAAIAEKVERLPTRPFDDTTVREAHEWAAELVAHAEVAGEIDIQLASTELLEVLWGPAFATDDGVLDMCARILRRAISHADRRALIELGRPAFLTIKAEIDGDERWVRVPFHRATVGQFRWVLEARRRTADDAVRAVEAWERLVAPLADRSDDDTAYPAPWIKDEDQ